MLDGLHASIEFSVRGILVIKFLLQPDLHIEDRWRIYEKLMKII